MPGEQTFEQRFSSIAETMLMEKVPAMREDYIGFQLIEKSDDATFAIGVAAHILDQKSWVYIPVFFLDGKIKGMDLMFVYQKDKFVPARDNWVSSLKREGVEVLGRAQDDKERSNRAQSRLYAPADAEVYSGPSSLLGKQAAEGIVSIIGKEAYDRLSSDGSLLPPEAWARMRLGIAGDRAPSSPDSEGTMLMLHAPSLQDITYLGKQACEQFVTALIDKDHPTLANELMRYRTPDQLWKLASSLLDSASAAETAIEENSKLSFITPDMAKEAADLTDKEKRLLLNNGVYIRDERMNTSQVLQAEQDPSILQNPTENGIYDVLLSNGNYERMAVLIPQIDLTEDDDSFYRSRRRWNAQHNAKNLAVVPFKTTTTFIPAKSDSVFAKRAENVSKSEATRLTAGMAANVRNIRSLMKDHYGRLRVLFAHCHDNTVLTDIKLAKPEHTSVESSILYVPRDNYIDAPDKMDEPIRIVFTDQEEGKLLVDAGTLYIPKGTVMFVQGSDYYAIQRRKNRKDGDGMIDYAPSISEDSSILFGKPDVVRRNLMKKSASELAVFWSEQKTGLGGLSHQGRQVTGLDSMELLRKLTQVHGIHAGTAQQMMKQAARQGGRARFIIKHAAPYDMLSYADSVEMPYQSGPAFKEDHATRIQTDQRKLQGISDTQYRRSVVDEATQRSQAGIREVLDVAIIQAMLGLADMGEVRRELLGKMIAGMDAFGRMLFYFYYANEHFEERYGHTDMKQLETSLRETFTETGDVVLFLREKTESDPMLAESLVGTLSEDIGSARA